MNLMQIFICNISGNEVIDVIELPEEVMEARRSVVNSIRRSRLVQNINSALDESNYCLLPPVTVELR
jgi:hypothetical protein